MGEDFVVYLPSNLEEQMKKSIGTKGLPKWANSVDNDFTNALRSTVTYIERHTKQTAKERYTAHPRKFKVKKQLKQGLCKIDFKGPVGSSLGHFRPRPRTLKIPRPAQGVTTQIKRTGKRYPRSIPGYSKPFATSTRKSRGAPIIFARKEGTRKNLMFLMGPSTIQAIVNKDVSQELFEDSEREFWSNILNATKKSFPGAK